MDRLTEEQGAILSAFTGLKLSSFDALHVYAERVLGRPVFTHEFGSSTFAARLREAAREDFMALMPREIR